MVLTQYSAGSVLECAGRRLDLSRPVVIVIIHVTPDSFSDGASLSRGSHLYIHRALTLSRQMVASGAAILDIGGESTRPDASPVSVNEEMDRVLPLVARIAAELETVISVDTSTPVLMREAANAGAGLLNDVRALTREGALEAAAAADVPICLMHMQGEPGNMQVAPHYDDVVEDVCEYLQSRIASCERQGIARNRLLLDPGFGFGKSVTHNLKLLRELPRLAAIGLPLVVSLSRKSLIGKLLGREVGQRLPASLALAVLAAQRGAAVIRTHDVAATVDAVSMLMALEECVDL